MKNLFALLILSVLLGNAGFTQPWMDYLPDNKRNTTNFFEMKEAYQNWLQDHEGEQIRAQKQFNRMDFFLNGRINEDGTFPTSTYWNEAMRIVDERSNRSGLFGDWNSLGPSYAPMILSGIRQGGVGRIDCITFHPTDPNIIYVGSPSGGLWKTDDGGISWEVLTDNLPTLGVSDLKINPNYPDSMYLATGTRDVWWETYSVGVLRSADGGYTWEETGLSFDIIQTRQVNEIIMDPQNSNILLAATSSGLYKTTNAGVDWTLVLGGNIKDLEYRPGDFSIIYASSFNYFGGAIVFQSTNSGDSFGIIQDIGFNSSQVNRITIGVTPADPDMVYLLCSDASSSGFYGVYMSEDNGSSWTHTSAGTNLNLLGWAAGGNDVGGQGWFTLSLAVSPTDPYHIYVGGVNIWQSFDSGESWDLNAHWLGWGGADYVHADIHNLVYNPLDQVLYTSNDGGIYQQQASGDEWLDISDGIVIYQIYRLGLYENDDGLALASPQDNGTTLFNDAEFTELLLAEACDNFIDYNDPQIMYYGGYGTGLVRSLNGGSSYTNIHPPGANQRFNPPYIINPVNSSSIYSAFDDVFKSTNRGDDWEIISGGIGHQYEFNCLEVAPSDTNYIYAADYRSLWVSSNDGESWTDISGILPVSSLNINDIAISGKDPQQVCVVFSGFFTDEKIYMTMDAGQTWENISMNLPNMPVNCAIYENDTDDGVYVGTDIGIYYTNNELDEWVDFSDGLPNVIILEMEINYKENKIKAATYGRGLWESPLYNSAVGVPEEPIASEFSIYPNPSKGIFTIDIDLSSNDNYSLIIKDMLGKTVFEESTMTGAGYYQKQIDLSSLPIGAYIVFLRNENGHLARKILKR